MAAIKINDRFSMEYDGSCWVLTEYYQGWKTDKETGKKIPDTKSKNSYYPKIEQVLEEIINRYPSESATCLQDIIVLLQKAVDEIKTALQDKCENKKRRTIIS